MIESKSISLSYGETSILKEISYDFHPGTRYSIIGPNGAGKTSYFRCLSGSETSYFGQIKLSGQKLDSWNPTDLAMKRGVLSQSLEVEFPFTALEIVLLGRTPYSQGNNSAKDLLIAKECMKSLSVWELKDRQYRVLSGGEKQRIQIARVLAQIWETNEAYLLLDEPTSALDLKQSYELLRLIEKLVEQQELCVIMIMHDLSLVRHFTDQTLVISDGRLVESGPSKSVIRKEVISEVYNLRQEDTQFLLAAA